MNMVNIILSRLLLLCSFYINTQLSAQQTSSSKDSSTRPEIFGEGIISTGDYETHPAFSPGGDTLYFLKCLSDANFCTICVSYYKNNKWTSPQVVPFSGRYLDADPFVTKDGNTIYFVSNRPIHEGDAVKEDWDIWKAERKGNTWGNPVHLDGPVNSSASEYFPTIADNGDLYFGSGRANGKGGADIYVSKWKGNGYEELRNLGDSINTPGNEYEPFIAPDESYLIFMATPNGIAHADFYISHNVNGTWSKAKKLPALVNSSATEWGGKVSPDGKYFFFGSSRNKINDRLPAQENIHTYEKRLRSAGNGLGDIYRVRLNALMTD